MKKKSASSKAKVVKKKTRRTSTAEKTELEKGGQWQRQADHFQEVIDEMEAVVADPETTPEDLAEAKQTIIDMTANLSRLMEKHGVTPAS